MSGAAMTPDSIQEHLRLAAVTAAVETDRRRPGRNPVSPVLVDLLRAPAIPEVANGRQWLSGGSVGDRALLADAKASTSLRREMIVGLLVAPLWMIIGALVFALLK